MKIVRCNRCGAEAREAAAGEFRTVQTRGAGEPDNMFTAPRPREEGHLCPKCYGNLDLFMIGHGAKDLL